MTADIGGLDQIFASMREPIRKYAENVQALAGANGLALTVFGSIAAGSFNPATHTARSVVVLESIDLEMLRRLAKDGAKLGKSKIAAPLIMTPEYITASVDTFPLELIEIQQRHICIFGQDYFEELAFEEAHIRLQCERESKTILIAMRQGLLAAAGREKLFAMIEADVAERLVRTLRGLLWLHGQREAKSAVQAVGEIECSMNRSLSGVRGAIDEQSQHGWEEFQSLYQDVAALGKMVDAW